MTIYIKGSGNPLTHAQMDENMRQLQINIDAVGVLQSQVANLISASTSPVTQADIDEAVTNLLTSLNENYASSAVVQQMQQELHQTRSSLQTMIDGLISSVQSALALAESNLASLVAQRDAIVSGSGSFGSPELDALAIALFNALISNLESTIANYNQQLASLEHSKMVFTTNGTWYC